MGDYDLILFFWTFSKKYENPVISLDLGPETDIILQFLVPEPVKMVQQNFWRQKLKKYVSFCGQKQYFNGEMSDFFP